MSILPIALVSISLYLLYVCTLHSTTYDLCLLITIAKPTLLCSMRSVMIM